MLLSIETPIYNTIIVFTIIIILIYISKPDFLYDKDKNEFRQFGTTNGKTLLPIHILAILLAILLYIFFHHVSNTNISTKSIQGINQKINQNPEIIDEIKQLQQLQIQEQIRQLQQLQQMQQMQNQINTLMMSSNQNNLIY